jgi:Flp pilus assembly protein TadB
MLSNYSTVIVLLITYFIAAIVWVNGPSQMAEFLNTSIGAFLVAGSMALQGLGIVWMSAISKTRL